MPERAPFNPEEDSSVLAQYPILAFFEWAHLPIALQVVSARIADAAWYMARELPPSAEVSAGLRKLLEAKDCFVRAALPPRG
ncbi:MAG TPA: hypothetical protein VI589_06905 [Vicinamibacteria bacterium]